MNRQYTLINECLDVLHRKNTDAIQKLRFEIQLCKLKRLLLKHDLDEATGECFTVSLQAVCRKMADLGEEEMPLEIFEELSRELQRVVDLAEGTGSDSDGG